MGVISLCDSFIVNEGSKMGKSRYSLMKHSSCWYDIKVQHQTNLSSKNDIYIYNLREEKYISDLENEQ